MKRLVFLFCALLMFCVAFLALYSCEEEHVHTEIIDKGVAATDTEDGLTDGMHCSDCGEVLKEQEIIPANIQGVEIKSDALLIDGDKMEVSVSDTTESFSFADDISVNSAASYIVATDLGCVNAIPSKTVELSVGDNVFYILVNNGNDTKLYTVIIHRLPYIPPAITTQHTISYYDEDGTLLEERIFNRGDSITYPDKDKKGYLTEWVLYDENFEEISIDTVEQNIKAVIKYKLIDVLVTIMDSVSGENLWVKYYYYGEIFNAEDIDIDLNNKVGFKYLGLSDDGGLTFKTEFQLTDSIYIEAVYEPIEYKIIYRDYDTGESLGEYIYKYTDGAYTLPEAPTKAGYTFEGWYVPDAYAPGGVKKIGDNGTGYQITEEVTEFYARYTKKDIES